MRRNILILTVFLFSLFFIPSISANQNWWQEANSDYYVSGGNAFIGYGSNINNPFTEHSYSKCSIGGSIYTPVSDDIDGDSENEIISVGNNKLNIYNFDCILETSIDIENPVQLSYETVEPESIISIFTSGSLSSIDAIVRNNDTITTLTTGLTFNETYDGTLSNFVLINLTPDYISHDTNITMVYKTTDENDVNESICVADFLNRKQLGRIDIDADAVDNFTTVIFELDNLSLTENVIIHNCFEDNNLNIFVDYIYVSTNRPSNFTETGIRAMPVLLNTNENNVTEMYILSNESMLVYEYSFLSETYIQKDSYDYYLETGDANLDYLTCLFDYSGEQCFGFGIGSRDGYVFDLSDKDIDKDNNMLNKPVVTQPIKYTGLSNSRTIPSSSYYVNLPSTRKLVSRLLFPLANIIVNGFVGFDDYLTKVEEEEFRIPMCFTVDNNHQECTILEADGSTDFVIENSVSFGSGNAINQTSAYIGKIGTQFIMIVSSTAVNTSNSDSYIFVSDMDGNILHEDDIDNSGYYGFSNIVLADYDKSGSNELCYIKHDNTGTFFKCYDQDFNTVENFNISTLQSNIDKSLILADFNSSETTLGIATQRGIYYPTYEFFDTGFTTGDGYAITVFPNRASTGSPAYIYSQSDRGFIIKDGVPEVLCGNGVCDITETSFSCPQDCGSNATGEAEDGELEIGYHCTTTADCEYGLQCEYGYCAKSGNSYECDDNSDCLSNECLRGQCTLPTYWNRIDASKTQQYGSDTNTNNFISMFFMLMIPAFIIWWGRSLMAIVLGIVSFIVLAVFFTVVGWLSVYILLLGVIGLIIALAILVLIGLKME